MISRKHILSIFLIFISSLLIAQSNFDYYNSHFKITTEDTNKLFFDIYNNNFFINNEYGGDIVKGYTIHGFNLTPKITYIPSSKLKLSGGFNILSYYGREEMTDFQFVMTFQYNLLPRLDFVLGSINGNLNHNLIEPLFDFERFYLRNVENGIQFLWDSKKLKADLWLDWEYQIFQGDPERERFNVGLVAKYELLNTNGFSIEIPFQNLVRHEGGQINDNDQPVVTIYDNALGLTFKKAIKKNYISVSSYWLNYQDLSSTKEQVYIDGMGSYSTLEFNNPNFDFLLGYYYADEFIAPIGDPIYQTYNKINPLVTEPIRKLISGKFNYHKDVYKGINLGARIGAYYDLVNPNLDYYWSLVVVFDGRFFLKEF